jgi:hypothetical protein
MARIIFDVGTRSTGADGIMARLILISPRTRTHEAKSFPHSNHPVDQERANLRGPNRGSWQRTTRSKVDALNNIPGAHLKAL